MLLWPLNGDEMGDRRKWDDNIKMDLKEMAYYIVDWLHLDQDRDQWRAFVNTVLRRQAP
jgi:hypothetical protein